MAASHLTGYGPSTSSRFSRLYFDGDEREYEMWEQRFLGYLRLKGLKATVLPVTNTDEPEDAELQEEAYAELIMFLDKRSLGLVMRDAKDNGRKAMKILRDHYAGTGKPRVMTLYISLSNIRKGPDESITDYVIRAEQIATSLRAANEMVSDGLLVAMVSNGLPSTYQPFIVSINQNDDLQNDFSKFKVALRNYEETENMRSGEKDNIMKSRDSSYQNAFRDSKQNSNHERSKQRWPSKKASQNAPTKLTCFSCGNTGHKANVCPNKEKLWCSLCRSSSHSDKSCRKQTQAKQARGGGTGVSVGFLVSRQKNIQNYALAIIS